jgi:hypothetical protein
VGVNLERSPDSTAAIALLEPGDLSPSSQTDLAPEQLAAAAGDGARAGEVAGVLRVVTLAELAPGSRLVLRCRKDWRAAAVSALTPDCVVLTVASPSGHTYRVRRPHDSPLAFDGSIPILCDRDSSGWRVALARYDARW